jgi:DNA-binding transcriptional ArsR family regulator
VAEVQHYSSAAKQLSISQPALSSAISALEAELYVPLFQKCGRNVKLTDYGKEFYPDKLSLAELIEYGTGLVGAESSKHTGDEWEYMANPNRDYKDGWEWNNESYSNFPTPTMGQEGRYIYYQLAEYVKEHLENWVDEYIGKLIGGNL